MKVKGFMIMLLILSGISCQKDLPASIDPQPADMYFPPLTGNTWTTVSAAELGWNATALENTYTYLQQKNTKAFIILHKGRVVAEKYFGTFTADSLWYWASAGKTLTAMLVGQAQQEGYLKLSDPVSKYLGTGWTSLTAAQEQQITIRHQLTMTSGLNDGIADSDCTLPACLKFKSAAGARWAYHNAPYTLLDKVVENATGKSYNTYFQEKIRSRIGMNGIWLRSGSYNNVYYSNARSMARYGLLLLNKGQWNGTAILQDTAYMRQMLNTSQNLNLSYGYLIWLNGKSTHMLPTVQFVFNGFLVPNAPADMVSALGKNDQKIYVVPSKDLVIIRMGDPAGNVQLAVSSFDNELWGYLKKVF